MSEQPRKVQNPLTKADDVPTSPDSFKVPVTVQVPDMLGGWVKKPGDLGMPPGPSKVAYAPDVDVAGYIRRQTIQTKPQP